MDSYAIGISGLTASQKALDVIGNNIANAATEGYHRQRIELTPARTAITRGNILGGGVDVAGVTRIIDRLLEEEITRQQSSFEQTGCQLDTLRMVESAMGDISSGGIGADIDQFFNALQDLSLHPTDLIYQQQAASAADRMCQQFRTTAQFFNNLEEQIVLEANNTIDQINTLIKQIAQFNGVIEDLELNGKQSGNLRDSRDKLINDLSKLAGIQTTQREYGVVDIMLNGVGVVTDRTSVPLEIKTQADGKLGIAAAGNYNFVTEIQGGKLGGLFSLKNELLPTIHGQLDTMASAIISQINKNHVQGVGQQGSFSDLAGWAMVDQNLADFQPPVTNGKIYIRITNQATGEITRSSIDVTAASDTLSDVASRLDAIAGISASVVSGALHITADSGYKFDFLPGILTAPTTSNLSGTAIPTLSGIYSGATNQTFTCTVVGSGQIGLDSGLSVEVRNGAGELVTTLNVGAGYAAGDKLQIANDINVSFNLGTLNAGETFTIEALANSDTSGVLAAAGVNTFFSGTDAANIAVNPEIWSDPSKIATAIGPDMNDNNNIVAMAQLGQLSWDSLDNKSPSDYFKGMVATMGQEIALKDTEHTTLQGLIQNLTNQQDGISGVDINDEAAQMLVFERLFQAMGKYMQTIQTSMDTLMSLISTT
jgi:flagellar hook-associated protein 1 FlgK